MFFTQSEKQGFTLANSSILALLTVSYIVGEISHFLIGTVSKKVAQDIEFGKKGCYDISNSTVDTSGLDKCIDFEDEESWERELTRGSYNSL